MNWSCTTEGFCELLHDVSRACARKEAEALARSGVAVAEFHALAEMARSPELKLEHLAASLSVSRGRLTRILDRLEQKGLIERDRSATDQRNVVLTMTKKGSSVLEEAEEMRGAAGTTLLSALTPSQQDLLVEGLELLKSVISPEAGQPSSQTASFAKSIDPRSSTTSHKDTEE